jgi:RimJ/RimL family protein N-acetyltransferase
MDRAAFDPRDVRLRPIRPDDKVLLQRGLAHLSLASTVQRFLGPKPAFSAAELRYLTEVDMVDHVALVAMLGDELIAVGRFVRDPERPDHAEIAITVADPYQGRGLGTLLGHALATEARARGIARFTALLHGTNEAAHRLFRRICGQLDSELRDGVREVAADVPPAIAPV